MSTTTSLTLRALLKTAVARTGIDAAGGTVAGLSWSAQARECGMNAGSTGKARRSCS